MSVQVAQVTFDCDDALSLAQFWSAVVELPVDEGASPFFASVGCGGPGALMFLKVPESKTAKNRVHLDLHSATWDTDRDRLLALGATLVGEFREYGQHWVTLVDPEGNEFCLGES